jgi:hypothetical protein
MLERKKMFQQILKRANLVSMHFTTGIENNMNKMNKIQPMRKFYF